MVIIKVEMKGEIKVAGIKTITFHFIFADYNYDLCLLLFLIQNLPF